MKSSYDCGYSMKVFVIGGLARSLINFRGPFLKAMLSRGHSVFTAAGGTTPEVESQLKDMGIEHHDIPMEHAGLNPINDMKVVIYLTKNLRIVKPDLTLNYTIKPVIYGSFAALLSGVPRIFSMITGLGYLYTDTSYRRRFLARICSSLYRLNLRNNAAVFFQNPDDEVFFSERNIINRRKKTVILNGSGVDLIHYSPAPIPKEPSFLLIARLLGDKGIREYTAAARLVKAKYPDVIFRLVGGTDPNPACIPDSEIQEWVKEGVIEYLGHLEDVRTAIAKSSVYVLPSYYREGTPRTVLEAMAMGRPIITTDAPGCRETIKRKNGHGSMKNGKGIIKGENGFLIPVKDPARLAKAMEQFIKQPKMIHRMGNRSIEIATERYDVHKVNDIILRTMGL